MDYKTIEDIITGVCLVGTFSGLMAITYSSLKDLTELRKFENKYKNESKSKKELDKLESVISRFGKKELSIENPAEEGGLDGQLKEYLEKIYWLGATVSYFEKDESHDKWNPDDLDRNYCRQENNEGVYYREEEMWNDKKEASPIYKISDMRFWYFQIGHDKYFGDRVIKNSLKIECYKRLDKYLLIGETNVERCQDSKLVAAFGGIGALAEQSLIRNEKIIALGRAK
jgi:hypothetical protein